MTRSRRSAKALAPWVAAVAAILRGTPSLPRALCRGDARFTSDDEADQAEAIEICQLCPELARCRQWVERLPPSRRPAGVIAGRINQPTKPRKRADK